MITVFSSDFQQSARQLVHVWAASYTVLQAFNNSVNSVSVQVMYLMYLGMRLRGSFFFPPK